MPAPPPYTESHCRIDGCEESPASTAGPFRGLCLTHRAEVVEERRVRRAAGGGKERDPNTDEVRVRKQPQLAATVRDLVPLATKLEKAIDVRQSATTAARTALMDFKEGLQLVGRVAQSLVNQRLPAVESEDES
jgi:hypothetical protein